MTMSQQIENLNRERFFKKTFQQKKLGILKQMADSRGAAGKI